jgi:hypothetical protein
MDAASLKGIPTNGSIWTFSTLIPGTNTGYLLALTLRWITDSKREMIVGRALWITSRIALPELLSVVLGSEVDLLKDSHRNRQKLQKAWRHLVSE